MSKSVRWTRAAAIALVFIAVLAAFFFVRPIRASRGTKARALTTEQLVKRGEYLVRAVACDDCHTPLVMGPNGPEPDMSRMLSGHPQDFVDTYPTRLPEVPGFWMWAPTNTAFVGAFGRSYAANLTPDQNTGLGIWTEDLFIKALRTGRHFGTSRPIMPPMPWQAIAGMTDEDLRGIYAYLRSIPPISNRVPDSEPAA